MNADKKNFIGKKSKISSKIKTDTRLNAYSGLNLFPEKLAKANKIIAHLNLGE